MEGLDPVLDTDEIMVATKLSKSKVCQLLRAGEIRAFRLGARWVARRSAVYEYLQRVEEAQLGVTA